MAGSFRNICSELESYLVYILSGVGGLDRGDVRRGERLGPQLAPVHSEKEGMLLDFL